MVSAGALHTMFNGSPRGLLELQPQISEPRRTVQHASIAIGYLHESAAQPKQRVFPELVAQLLTRTRTDKGLQRLSPREREVLALMAEGLGNGAIAERLVVGDGAIHKHIRSIFTKLDLVPSNRADRRVTAVLRYLQDPQH